ncbi:MAG TPA: hypothetical protein VG944_05015 [Fimbriimonas sp.]|nr:hypothetical protein [Fimbriimonas sp.]
MAGPLVTFSTVKFLWNESKPVRQWLWNKLPFAQDQIKKEKAEALLATLLEDSNKLARALPPEEADDRIDRLIEQFRKDLIAEKIPADQADMLVERGGLFVKLLVTGPMGETAALRERVAELEQVVEGIEGELSRLKSDSAKPDRSRELEIHLHRLRMQVILGWVVAGIALAVSIASLFRV